MKQLLHTLFVTEDDIELCLRGESLEAKKDGIVISHIPLHNLDGIVSFSYRPASPALMTACAAKEISFIALNRSGKLKYRVCGRTSGNPALRLIQYENYNNPEKSLLIAQTMIEGKLRNGIALIRRYGKNHKEQQASVSSAVENLTRHLLQIKDYATPDSLRGLEGTAARVYFDMYSQMIRSNDDRMQFESRSSRPPENPCNALLSLSYTLLTNLCVSALESVGLDPYFGFLHSLKSGKPSLALDLMEELRPVMSDRMVMRAINLGIIKYDDFTVVEDSWQLTEDGLKKYFSEWNRMREHEVSVTGYDEKIPLGLLPYFQAQKLSRYLYGKDENYAPYEVKDL